MTLETMRYGRDVRQFSRQQTTSTNLLNHLSLSILSTLSTLSRIPFVSIFQSVSDRDCFETSAGLNRLMRTHGIENTVATLAEDLTILLARRVMGWGVAPERFLLGRGGWIPRWRFQPVERLEDAFRLLEESNPQRYSMGKKESSLFWVKVRIGGVNGQACDQSKPRAITLAVARALRITT